MLNDQFFLQFFIIIILFFILFSKDLFFSVLNSVFFLFLISTYAWALDFDILINFLLIIDLGLFFILFSFFLNASNLFASTAAGFTYNFQLKIFYFIFFNLIVFSFFYTHYSVNIDLFSYLITYYNWFNILNFLFFADLQLLSEFYFNFNLFEFILMNFYIYTSLFIVYYIYFLPQVLETFVFWLYNSSLFFFKKLDFSNFVKFQDFQKQRDSIISTRVWRKNTTAPSNGSKTNMSSVKR